MLLYLFGQHAVVSGPDLAYKKLPQRGSALAINVGHDLQFNADDVGE